MASLPSTNLTMHGDASDNDHLWKTLNGGGSGIPSGVPADGDIIQVWQGEPDGSVTNVALVPANGGAGSTPVWRSSTPLMLLPCLDLDGSDKNEAYTADGATSKALSNFIANNAWTFAIAFYPESITAANANPWANHVLYGDSGGFAGMFLKDSAGTKIIYVYNWDGNADVSGSVTIATNQSWVAIGKHEAGSLTLRVIADDRSVTDATNGTSGNTTTLTGRFGVGSSSLGAGLNGRIGEYAIYNAALSGSDYTDLQAYFTDKWIGVAASRRKNPILWGWG